MVVKSEFLFVYYLDKNQNILIDFSKSKCNIKIKVGIFWIGILIFLFYK